MSTARLDFSQRADLVEKMDQPCSYEELRACLHYIARVNRLTFAYRPTTQWLEKVVATRPSEPLRIVDVGCGYGDTLRTIEAWAGKNKIPVTLTGIDLKLSLDAKGCRTPVIMITARLEPHIHQLALASGACSLLRKPFKAGALIASVEKALGITL